MSAPLGEDAMRHIAEEALRLSHAGQTEVRVDHRADSLTRFAANAIHQNVATRDVELSVRAVFGKRVATATTNRTDAEGVRRVVEEAETLARLAHEDPEFVSLPAAEGGAPEPVAVGGGTLRSDPERRAEIAATLCAAARQPGMQVSGSVSAGILERSVLSSLGVGAYGLTTAARVVALVHGGGSGYGEAHNLEIESIDAEAIARTAVAKARSSVEPIGLGPGDYQVVLEPCAVANVVQFLCMLGFGARAMREGTSFVSGKLGRRILGANVTLVDDARDDTGMPSAFDAEGIPRQRLSLVRDGVAEQIAYDSYYAHMEGRRSTGHALTGRFGGGPIPVNSFLLPGGATLDELIHGVRRGILVTRFHYTRTVHPLSATVTGMTRDGTFLIEHGEIVRPVKNLRFTQSYVEALNNVEAVGAETALAGDWIVSRVPALRIGRFAFTGSTL